jgi:hypothetical protein
MKLACNTLTRAASYSVKGDACSLHECGGHSASTGTVVALLGLRGVCWQAQCRQRARGAGAETALHICVDMDNSVNCKTDSCLHNKAMPHHTCTTLSTSACTRSSRACVHAVPLLATLTA